MSDEEQSLKDRIEVLEGETAALRYLVIALVDVLGSDVTSKMINLISHISTHVAIGRTLKTHESFLSTLERALSDLEEPILRDNDGPAA